MVEFARRTVSDECGMMNAGRDCRPPTACPVETMMTADSLRLTACGLGRMRRQKHAGAVSRRPMANVRQLAATDKQIDTLVYELYGLTEEEVRVVEAREKR